MVTEIPCVLTDPDDFAANVPVVTTPSRSVMLNVEK
jgi:hypothetical protein